MNKIFSFKSGLLLSFLFYSSILLSQPVDPPADDDPLPTPIDSGLVFLLIAGLLFAGFYFFKLKKINSIN